ncbi:hypothetical protein [Undibacterium sp.]|uniref:hypothetical protein n=1 Tax=Undibacterium sp. TaxID=1914977 RepID=UPI00374D1196
MLKMMLLIAFPLLVAFNLFLAFKHWKTGKTKDPADLKRSQEGDKKLKRYSTVASVIFFALYMLFIFSGGLAKTVAPM